MIFLSDKLASADIEPDFAQKIEELKIDKHTDPFIIYETHAIQERLNSV